MESHIYYCKNSRSWWAYWLNEDGDQFGDAVFAHAKKECLHYLYESRP